MDPQDFPRAEGFGPVPGDETEFTGGTSSPRFGINLNLEFVPIYANIVRHAHWFCPADNPNAATNVPLDQYQCPTTDFSLSIALNEAAYGPNGDMYAIQFRGQSGNMTCSLGGGTITGQAWDPATNTTTATLNLPPNVKDNLIWLNFRQTKRVPADAAGNGIDARYLYVMRPTAPGAATHHAVTEKFNRQLAVACAPWLGGHFRDLDCRFINAVPNAPAITPASRTPPYSPLQAPYGPTQGNSPTRGMCFEDVVELANFLGMDLWTNFEDTGTDELFQLYLNICKYGSDATGTAYTAAGGSNPVPAGGPVHPPLAGRLLWEEGNEDWNFSFAQTQRYVDRGNANAGSLGANGETAGLDTHYCQIAADLLRHADLARATFPNALGVRYCPILCGQTVTPGTMTDGLTWLQRRLALRGETVVQNIYGAGADTYEQMVGDDTNPADAATADAVTAILATPPYKPGGGLPSVPILVVPYGIAPSSYDGGLASNVTALDNLLQHDPRFGAIVRDRAWNLVDCGYQLITPYSLIAGGWSLLDSIWDLTHPKWIGWRDAIAAYPMDGRVPAARPTSPPPCFSDPSFELPALPMQPHQVRMAPVAGSPWTFAGTSGVNGPDWAYANYNVSAATGRQCCVLGGSGDGSSAISQAVSGFTPGASYLVGGSQCYCLTTNATCPFDVLVDGVVIGSFTTQAVPYFQFFSAPFTATKATHTVTFRTASRVGNQVVLLDGMTITPTVIAAPIARATRHGGAAGLIGAVGGPSY